MLDKIKLRELATNECSTRAAYGKEIIVALLDELEATTKERDELKRLAKAHLKALDAEAKANESRKVAEENFSDPAPERTRHARAMAVTYAASKALRKAVEGV